MKDDITEVTAEGFVPICTSSQDVQELLFADPIHEVEEDDWEP